MATAWMRSGNRQIPKPQNKPSRAQDAPIGAETQGSGEPLMPVRSPSHSKSFFDPEVASPRCLNPGGLPWLLAKMREHWFPEWLFADWRGKASTGREAWPAAVLLCLTFLRWSEEGMSRRGSVRRAGNDLSWRAAMGLQVGGPTPSERTLRDFEGFLRQRHPATGTPRYLLLHEHIVRACVAAGISGDGAAWAMDSTPMWCYGAVKDTIRLLGDGVGMLARMWSRATGSSIEVTAADWEAPFVLAKSTKGSFDVDWRAEGACDEVVSKLATTTLRVIELVQRDIQNARSSLRKALLRRCKHLARVVSQDMETSADGRLVIATRVAADRLVSITDPQARHGRKSKSKTFNGFKVHLLGDVVSGLIASAAVTSGNVHDGGPAHRLIRRAKRIIGEISRVMGDTAYGGARLRHIVQGNCDVKLLSPPPPTGTSKSGKLGRLAVVLDFDQQTATCANGTTTADKRMSWSSEHGMHVPSYAWPKEACDACPKSQACRGKAERGHRVVLHPYEQSLREAREEWRDEEVRRAYRTRSQCERLIHTVTRAGGRRARAFGLGAAQLQVHAIVAASNLRLLARALGAQEEQRKAG